AIAGTDDRAANARVWAEAEREGVLLNAVDDLDHCSFIAPAIHREGDITVAVSTSGKSPALAARLRQRVARRSGPAEARLCAVVGELRPELAARVPDTRARTILDRKSTRLNSSHVAISYAVFRLKKKNQSQSNYA